MLNMSKIKTKSAYQLILPGIKTFGMCLIKPHHIGYWIRIFKSRYFYPYLYYRTMPIKKQESGLYSREYQSTKDYISHQRSKLKIANLNLDLRFEKRLNEFIEVRFSKIFKNQTGSSVLCLGARDGVEVAALRKLGHLAIGIDIEFPSANSFVHYGDFHRVPYPDTVFDYVYMNVFDHVLDPERVLEEISRTLKVKGLFVLDLQFGRDDEEFEGEESMMGPWEACGWDKIDTVIELIENSGFVLDSEMSSSVLRPGYTQLVFGVENHNSAGSTKVCQSARPTTLN